MDRYLINKTIKITNKIQFPKFLTTQRVEGHDCQDEAFLVEFDINNNLYDINKGEKHQLVISQEFDKEIDKGYQYVMYGKLFEIKLQENSNKQMVSHIYISFGGLQCKFEALTSKFDQRIREGLRIYLMIKEDK
ncbi:Nucleic acid-binding, OB-fold [Pseudocohnilembus persalinus]|uniref:Nucleic acid-binding, OB-fold n=1 Tax=Pseudocohnilembus persalinus TaxID=266149 RepID=A0A0V0R2U2_PSEPJ|nr:Nucleic acid-binding, OB-fold [Pseudocohnilembus persalinus]|eukprot:KRX08650.1 Nucleic acid-binding, OB-fold [Pseudocohnilembus persalinus]